MEKKKKYGEFILVGFSFMFFLCITCYKLTNASLWFDETVEYWYSKIMFGKLPFQGSGLVNDTNMYDRIISTYQPPLYNFIMFFWLKISDSEAWFRFFGVVMGFIGMIAIYKSIKKISNVYIAALAVIFASTIYRLVYYWQECAEYCLMLGTLCWTIYYWLCLMEETNRKNIILFTVFAIIPVYSHYGAAFPVLAMIILTFIFVVLQKDKCNISTICISYISAFICAVIPLYFFFLKKQRINQQIVKQKGASIEISLSTIFNVSYKDFFENLETVFKWDLFPGYSDFVVRIIGVSILLLLVISFCFGKSKFVKWFILGNVICWMVYYYAVKLEVYAYGDFGNRYNLFFIPLWIIMIFAICIDIFALLAEMIPWKGREISNLRYVFVGACICLILCYGINSWCSELQKNWSKENVREIVNKWYEVNGYEKTTIVYYGAASGFSYYVKQNDDYNEKIENDVYYMKWYRGKSVDEYSAYLNELIGIEWPKEVYIVGSHVKRDYNTIIKCFETKGYVQEEVTHIDKGKIIRLNKK